MVFRKNKNLPENLPPIFHTLETVKDYTLIEHIYFIAYDFFDWWYIKMPIQLFKYAKRITSVSEDQLSLTLLLKTFFTPWHRDNKLVGYFMGMMMRILYIPIALFIQIIVVFLSYSVILLWILLPIISIIMLFMSPIIIKS